jgi:hypothetical protein
VEWVVEVVDFDVVEEEVDVVDVVEIVLFVDVVEVDCSGERGFVFSIVDTEVVGSVVVVVAESQQKVSLFHNLQERFSNLLPFSRDSAHFEKTGKVLV